MNIEMARKRGNKMEKGEAGSFIGRRVIDILPRNSSLRSLIQSHQTSGAEVFGMSYMDGGRQRVHGFQL